MPTVTPIPKLATAMAVVFLVACSPGGDETPPASSGAEEPASTPQAMAPESSTPESSTPEPVAPAVETPETAEPDAAASPLAGTRWRLVNIASMDDSNAAPDDRDLYTLVFAGDGTVSVRADCNRGTGTWTQEGDVGLRFGPMAATMALCPPESLHDRYLAQFEWVRSFVIEDGHLFLATMADGAIIEFEPAPEE